MTTQPLQSLTPQPQLTYVDRPEISETYADSLWRVTFNSMHLRMEFAVSRLDEPRQGQPVEGKAVTSCRVIMPLSGMIDMVGKLQTIMVQLQEARAIRQVNPAAEQGHSKAN